MKKISAIAILCLIVSAPVWAEKVYTNSSLRKYDAYKSKSAIKSSASQHTDETVADTDEKAENQEGVKIAEQKLSWTETNDDGSGKNYEWQVTLTNTYDADKQVNIEFNLLDKEGAVLNTANGNGTIGANKTETFSGTGTIKSQLATQAVRTSVKLTSL
ncbi:MAG: hypothetical protein KAH06_02435 [Desulfobacterales bacterium]|nr:hypothetical protein [Desulfobacterales bacterium]